MLLEPSSPFARPEHFDEAVELFAMRKASLVVGMRETEVASVFVGTTGRGRLDRRYRREDAEDDGAAAAGPGA